MPYPAGTPDSLPLFARLELASAALCRGLAAEFQWPELVLEARKMTVESRALNSAARVLDAAARHAPQTSPEQSREYGLWAAAAYAATGNIPSAVVAIRRTFVRLNRLDENTAALVAAVAPPLANRLPGSFASTLTAYLAGAATRDEVLSSWQSCLAPEEIKPLLEAALTCALSAGTRGVFAEYAAHLPENYRSHLSKRVPFLLPPQLDAVRAGYLSGSENALATLPPGSGKTLLGELFLISALNTEPGLSVFLSPYVALGRQVGNTLKQHLPDSYRLHVLLGGAQGEEDLRPDQHAEIIVATPERLDALLRHKPEMWRHLRAVVVDEAHLAGEAQRGVKLAGLLSRLRLQQQRGAKFRMLLLSGALADTESLREWADVPDSHFIHSTWTPTARRLGYWRQNGTLEWHADLADAGMQLVGAVRKPWPQPGLHASRHYVAVEQQLPKVHANVAHLTAELIETTGGPVLCLCGTRRGTRALALALREQMPVTTAPTGARAAALDAIEARHRHLNPLAECLKHGVAWHNATLPHEVRQYIEAAVAEGEVVAVAATSTLAEGVDLPFQSTIVVDWLAWGEREGRLVQSPMSPGLFRNIAGRCGRAGSFTEGDTILFDNPLGDEQFTAPERRSALISDLYLSDKLPLSAPERSTSAPCEVADSQLLAALCEGATPEVFLQAALPLSPELRQASVPQAWVENDLLLPDGSITELGRAVYRTDLSPTSALRLKSILEALPHRAYATTADVARLNAHLWRELGGVPEAGSEIRRLFAPRSRSIASAADLEKLGRQWLSGTAAPISFAGLSRHERRPIPELMEWVDGECATLDPVWGAEFDSFCDFQRNALETCAPWLWRASGILSQRCGNPFARQVAWQEWGWRWERGVDSRWACLALELGAPGGREAIAALGRVWPWPAVAPDKFGADPLRLSRLQDPEGQTEAEVAVETALKSLGGQYGAPGRNVLQLRDWLWARAGLTK